MNCTARTLAIVLLPFFGSCNTPLAATSYPIKELAGLEGEWLLTDFPGEGDWSQTLRIERVQEQEGIGGLTLLFPQPNSVRYRAFIDIDTDDDGGDESTEPIIIDGEVVQIGEHDYLTFQKTTEKPRLPIYFLDVPIQNTFRIELEGDEFQLLWHEERFLWLPIALSGEMEVSSGGQQGNPFGVLMSNLDDVLEAYEAANPDGWNVLATATRNP